MLPRLAVNARQAFGGWLSGERSMPFIVACRKGMSCSLFVRLVGTTERIGAHRSGTCRNAFSCHRSLVPQL